MSTTTRTPTTHGDWRVIDGQLVDVSALPPTPRVESVAHQAPTPPTTPAPRSLRRRKPR